MNDRPTTAMEGEAITLDVTIERDDVEYFLGYPEGATPPERIARLLDDVVVEARSLVRAAGLFLSLPTARAEELSLEPIDARGLVVGLVTIGGDIERRVSELIAAGEMTKALLFDAAGSAAVEEAANRLGSFIAGDDDADSRVARASHLSCRISPGYGRWPVSAQRKLFDLLPHAILGVGLLPSMLMVPRKSISFAMWMGADARPVSGLAGCSRCELERCRYRRA